MPYLTRDVARLPIVLPIGGQPGLAGGRGADGRSAYQIAVETGGYAGSEADFAAMLANPGASGTTVALVAAYDLPGGVFGAAYGLGGVTLATPSFAASATGQALGYIDSPAQAGDIVALRKTGSVRVPGSSWTAGDPIYVTDYGTPTNATRSIGWVQQVGIATGPDAFDLAIGPAAVVVPLITVDAVAAVIVQAMTDVVASLSLAPPDRPGTLWRNNAFPSLSPNADGTPYTAPYNVGLSGAVDAITALLPIAVPRALRSLPVDPPAAAGVLWLNNRRLALSPALDGSPYPTTPLPSSGPGLLPAVRPLLLVWLATTMPGLPMLSPISSNALWRSTNLLAVS